MTYGQLQADCLYTGISSGPNAWYRVWEAFTFFTLLDIIKRVTSLFTVIKISAVTFNEAYL